MSNEIILGSDVYERIAKRILRDVPDDAHVYLMEIVTALDEEVLSSDVEKTGFVSYSGAEVKYVTDLGYNFDIVQAANDYADGTFLRNNERTLLMVIETEFGSLIRLFVCVRGFAAEDFAETINETQMLSDIWKIILDSLDPETASLRQVSGCLLNTFYGYEGY